MPEVMGSLTQASERSSATDSHGLAWRGSSACHVPARKLRSACWKSRGCAMRAGGATTTGACGCLSPTRRSGQRDLAGADAAADFVASAVVTGDDSTASPLLSHSGKPPRNQYTVVKPLDSAT